jgi:hypothetical protein
MLSGQFDEDALAEHYDKYENDDSGFFGVPKRGELPKAGTPVFHGVEPIERNMLGVKTGAETGIHWTTAPRVASKFAQQGGSVVIAGLVEHPERQVIPRLSLQFKNVRDAEAMDDPTMLENEQEYHMRPGARIRVTNRDELQRLGLEVPEHISIRHPEGHMEYTNLEDFRVKDD